MSSDAEGLDQGSDDRGIGAVFAIALTCRARTGDESVRMGEVHMKRDLSVHPLAQPK